jgi:HAD superfamily hydrolase (TIGR01509 family)
MSLANVRALVFDVDGTLYSQRCLRSRILIELLRERCLYPRSLFRTISVLRAYRRAHELTRHTGDMGDARDRQLTKACQLSGESGEFVNSTIEEWFERRPLRHLRDCVYPGVRELLRRARQHGMRLGVMSDYPAADKLTAMGLYDEFDVVVSSHDASIGVLKPHPRGLLACLQHLAVRPDEAVYIGDRPDVDLPCAAGARTKFILLDNSRRMRNCITVTGYPQLSDLLGWPTQS